MNGINHSPVKITQYRFALIEDAVNFYILVLLISLLGGLDLFILIFLL